MAKEVILTPLAISNYQAIIEYLISEWSENVANDFVRRFNQVCDILYLNPQIYPVVNLNRQVRKCVLTKHNVIYFIETKSAIKILTIFDTRQTPEKLSNIF
jgi:plasmid stabilization system protein ParE